MMFISLDYKEYLVDEKYDDLKKRLSKQTDLLIGFAAIKNVKKG